MIVKIRFLPMDQISAPLRFVCPDRTPPLAAFTRLVQHSSGRLHQAFHRRGRVSIGTSLFGDAKSSLVEDTDNIDRFFNAT